MTNTGLLMIAEDYSTMNLLYKDLAFQLNSSFPNIRIRKKKYSQTLFINVNK
jgi:hypothetical protein